MSADAKIMEALLRLEHKVDLVLKLMIGGTPKLAMKKVGDVSHFCTLCDMPVDYQVDPTDAVVIRKCGCSTGKVALDMKAFAPPVTPARKNEDGRDNEQEDRIDPTGRRGLSKGR